VEQGCQIFLGPSKPKAEKIIPKLPQKIRMAIKYTKIAINTNLEIYQHCPSRVLPKYTKMTNTATGNPPVGEPVWLSGKEQGCQMVCFQTKNPNLGKFCRALDWKMLICFMAIWNILWQFGIFYAQLVHFVLIWYIFPVLVSCTLKNLATLAKSENKWPCFYCFLFTISDSSDVIPADVSIKVDPDDTGATDMHDPDQQDPDHQDDQDDQDQDRDGYDDDDDDGKNIFFKFIVDDL
jgi:hypothetical protein